MCQRDKSTQWGRVLCSRLVLVAPFLNHVLFCIDRALLPWERKKKNFPTLICLIHRFALLVAHIITICHSDLKSLSFLLCDQSRLLALVPFSLFGDLFLGDPALLTSPAHDVPSPAAGHSCSTRLRPLHPAGRVMSMQSDARADFR